MTNFEKYCSKISDMSYGDYKIGVKNGEPVYCRDINCASCELFLESKNKTCLSALFNWFTKEYVEPKLKLTKEEDAFCKIMSDGYIARDADETVWVYSEKPYKYYDHWDSDTGKHIAIDEEYFKFIEWGDAEPWNISELLKLEVEE